MKVYVVEHLWSHEGDDTAVFGSGITKVFAKEQDAVAYMKELAEEVNYQYDIFDDTGVREGWTVDGNEISWCAYEKNNPLNEYFYVFIEEREVL